MQFHYVLLIIIIIIIIILIMQCTINTQHTIPYKYSTVQYNTTISYSRLCIIDLGLASSIVDTKSEIGLADSGSSIFGTDIGGSVLTEFAGIFFDGIKSVIAIALVCFTILIRRSSSFLEGYTLAPMQADMTAPGTNFQFMFALNSKKSIGTDTMFPQSDMCLVGVGRQIVTEFVNQLIVFFASSAFAVILALQIACFGGGCYGVIKFANGSMVSFGTIASFVSGVVIIIMIIIMLEHG